jgi:hypothetical protein
MTNTLIFNEKGDIIFFKSLNDAEAYIEPIDVQNNEYVAYDNEGRLFQYNVLLLRSLKRNQLISMNYVQH